MQEVGGSAPATLLEQVGCLRRAMAPWLFLGSVLELAKDSGLGISRLARAGQHGHREGRPIPLPMTGITHRAQTGPHTPSMQCPAHEMG